MLSQSIKIIQSVQRSIDILNCFNDTSHHLSLNNISQRVNLNINTTRGLINTLTVNGLVIHDKINNLYSLGFYFIGKASIIQKQVESYITSAKSYVDNIAEKYHVTTSLQLVNQHQIYSIYCAYPSNTAYTIIVSEYTALPLYATSSGKLLMLYNLYDNNKLPIKGFQFKNYTPYTITSKEALIKNLEEIRKNKYASEIEEFELGVSSMAVPILDPNNQLIATVSATFFVNNLMNIKDNLLSDLKEIANEITNNFLK